MANGRLKGILKAVKKKLKISRSSANITTGAIAGGAGTSPRPRPRPYISHPRPSAPPPPVVPFAIPTTYPRPSAPQLPTAMPTPSAPPPPVVPFAVPRRTPKVSRTLRRPPRSHLVMREGGGVDKELYKDNLQKFLRGHNDLRSDWNYLKKLKRERGETAQITREEGRLRQEFKKYPADELFLRILGFNDNQCGSMRYLDKNDGEYFDTLFQRGDDMLTDELSRYRNGLDPVSQQEVYEVQEDRRQLRQAYEKFKYGKNGVLEDDIGQVYAVAAHGIQGIEAMLKNRYRDRGLDFSTTVIASGGYGGADVKPELYGRDPLTGLVYRDNQIDILGADFYAAATFGEYRDFGVDRSSKASSKATVIHPAQGRLTNIASYRTDTKKNVSSSIETVAINALRASQLSRQELRGYSPSWKRNSSGERHISPRHYNYSGGDRDMAAKKQRNANERGRARGKERPQYTELLFKPKGEQSDLVQGLMLNISAQSRISHSQESVLGEYLLLLRENPQVNLFFYDNKVKSGDKFEVMEEIPNSVAVRSLATALYSTEPGKDWQVLREQCCEDRQRQKALEEAQERERQRALEEAQERARQRALEEARKAAQERERVRQEAKARQRALEEAAQFLENSRRQREARAKTLSDLENQIAEKEGLLLQIVAQREAEARIVAAQITANQDRANNSRGFSGGAAATSTAPAVAGATSASSAGPAVSIGPSRDPRNIINPDGTKSVKLSSGWITNVVEL